MDTQNWIGNHKIYNINDMYHKIKKNQNSNKACNENFSKYVPILYSRNTNLLNDFGHGLFILEGHHVDNDQPFVELKYLNQI